MVRESATVFNVQGYSVHDGPGIRTTVFLKGCPLNCFWCQNPEAKKWRPEVLFNAEACTGCGKCVTACERGAISLEDGKAVAAPDRCSGQGDCATICPANARVLTGRAVEPEDIFRELAADAIFYQGSGGGVTLSGGDPLFYPGFCAELLRLCKQAGYHTAVDTCGYAAWPSVAQVMEHADLVLFDLKHMDSRRHEQGTGMPNELILENARRIHHELAMPMLARIPVIPGFNDSDEDMDACARFVSNDLGLSVPVHLIPYHRFGEAKRERLGMPVGPMPAEPPTGARLEAIKSVFVRHGLVAHVGG